MAAGMLRHKDGLRDVKRASFDEHCTQLLCCNFRRASLPRLSSLVSRRREVILLANAAATFGSEGRMRRSFSRDATVFHRDTESRAQTLFPALQQLVRHRTDGTSNGSSRSDTPAMRRRALCSCQFGPPSLEERVSHLPRLLPRLRVRVQLQLSNLLREVATARRCCRGQCVKFTLAPRRQRVRVEQPCERIHTAAALDASQLSSPGCCSGSS